MNRGGTRLLDNKWTMYVRMLPNEEEHIHKLVSKVDFMLHPSFGNPQRVAIPGEIDPKSLSADKGKNEASLTTVAWGYFEIEIKILFKNGLKVKISHMLKFSDGGDSKIVPVAIKKEDYEKLISA